MPLQSTAPKQAVPNQGFHMQNGNYARLAYISSYMKIHIFKTLVFTMQSTFKEWIPKFVQFFSSEYSGSNKTSSTYHLCVISMQQALFKKLHISFNPHNKIFYEVDSIIALILYMGKLRHGLVKLPVQRYLVFKWQSQDLNPDSVIPESMGLTTMLSSIYNYYK